jgi:hypothetical protein
MGPRTGMDEVKKRKTTTPVGEQYQVVQPLASNITGQLLYLYSAGHLGCQIDLSQHLPLCVLLYLFISFLSPCSITDSTHKLVSFILKRCRSQKCPRPITGEKRRL